MRLNDFAVIVCISLIQTSYLVSQPETKGGAMSTRPGSHVIQNLISEAQAARMSPSSARVYMDHLNSLFISPRAGNGVIAAMSTRLESAENLARAGKRPLVNEDAIVQAFDGLIAHVSGSSSQTSRTSNESVHHLRLALRDMSPSLSTVDSNPTRCMPSEAILVLVFLVWNDRSQSSHAAEEAGTVLIRNSSDDARSLITKYVNSHSRSDCEGLYGRVVKTLGL